MPKKVDVRSYAYAVVLYDLVFDNSVMVAGKLRALQLLMSERYTVTMIADKFGITRQQAAYILRQAREDGKAYRQSLMHKAQKGTKTQRTQPLTADIGWDGIVLSPRGVTALKRAGVHSTDTLRAMVGPWVKQGGVKWAREEFFDLLMRQRGCGVKTAQHTVGLLFDEYFMGDGK